MKFGKEILLIFSICLIFLTISCNTEPANKRVVIIGLDGLSVEGYQKSEHPNLDALMK